MTTTLVNASKRDSVMVLELSNPREHLSYAMMRELDAHVLDARRDESIHAVMISAAQEVQRVIG
jgi:enoyl-CoA hydratase/carnithine racemase